jgi:hypothetical protein
MNIERRQTLHKTTDMIPPHVYRVAMIKEIKLAVFQKNKNQTSSYVSMDIIKMDLHKVTYISTTSYQMQ